MDQPEQQQPTENKIISWLKRVGLIGFMFFLIKGLMWLFAGKLVADFFRNLFN